MIQGLSHLTFIVNDIERTGDFFKSVFDAEELYSSGERFFSLSREKFFRVANVWIAVMEGDSLSERTYNHVAFKIPDHEFEIYESKVRALNLDIRPSRPRNEREGRSLYFYDFDNHLFELHTSELSERLATYNFEGIRCSSVWIVLIPAYALPVVFINSCNGVYK